MTLYTVWSGEYSDRGMHAIFQSKEKAEKYMEVHEKINGPWSDDYYIIEYELEDDKFDIHTEPIKYYRCDIVLEDYIDSKGNVIYRAGEIETDSQWNLLMHDFLIDYYDDLKPDNYYNDTAQNSYGSIDKMEDDYDVPMEYLLRTEESFTEEWENLTVYSRISYAHARKVAIDKYNMMKAHKEGLC